MSEHFFHRRVLTALIVLGTGGLCAAPNLVRNSGFELGPAGFTLMRYMRPDTNSKMLYLPAEPDTASFVSGKQSLRLPNPFAEQLRLVADEMELKPGTKYTLSVWMKSSAADCKVRVSLISARPVGWVSLSREFDIGREWRRYSWSFQSGQNPQNRFYTLQFLTCQEKEAPAADLWLDDIQVNEGGLATCQPAAILEAAAVSADSVHVGTGGQGEAEIRVINHGSSPLKAEVGLKIIPDHSGNYPDKDPFYGPAVVISAGNVELAAHERKDIRVKMPLQAYGAFRLEAEIKNVTAPALIPGYFAVIGKYERKAIDPARSFCVGLNMGYNFGGDGYYYRKVAFLGGGGDPEAYFARFAAMGCRIIRDHDSGFSPFAWKTLEPEEGKFDFSFADDFVNISRKYGIDIMPVVGKMVSEPGAPILPEWLIKQSREDDRFKKEKRLALKKYEFPIAAWKNFLRALAGRYRGKIRFYEIMNEPNLTMTPADYVAYLKPAYEAIKTASPQANVVGICSTGDYGGNTEAFIEECCKLKGLEYTDIVSFHPYGAPRLSSLCPADRQIHAIRSLMKNYGGGNKPLWNSELYYLTGLMWRNPKSHYMERGLFEPADVARRFLIDLGEGVGQSLSVPGHQVFRQAAPHFGSSHGIIYDLTPNSIYVTYNALARMFEGARPMGKIRWPNDAICYLYERDGGYLAAFWNYGEVKDLSLTLQAPAGQAVLYDLYGNELKANPWPLKLGAAPGYLRWRGRDFKRFEAVLKQAVLEVEQALDVSAVRLLPDGGGWRAAVGVKNRSSKTMRGKLGINGNGLIGGKMVDFELGPGVERSFMVPVGFEAGYPKKTMLMVKLYVNGKLWNLPVRLIPAAKVSYATPQGGPFASLHRPDGRDAGAVSFNCAWDNKDLVLKINVRDATSSGDSGGRSFWDQDSVELFFDAAPEYLPFRHTEAYHDRTARLFLLPRLPQGKQLVVWPGKLKGLEASRLEIRSAATGYEMVLRIPLKALGVDFPLRGRCFGFDLAVNDAVGAEKAKVKYLWNSPDQAYRDRCSFGFICFTGEGK